MGQDPASTYVFLDLFCCNMNAPVRPSGSRTCLADQQPPRTLQRTRLERASAEVGALCDLNACLPWRPNLTAADPPELAPVPRTGFPKQPQPWAAVEK